MKRTLVLLGMTIVPFVAYCEQGKQEEEIIIADALEAPVFYEVAPTYIAASMQVAVQRECSNAEKSVSSKPESTDAGEWICSGGPIYFLRGIYKQGEEGEDGYACKGEAEWKYYAPGWFLENADCIALWYDDEKKSYVLR